MYVSPNRLPVVVLVQEYCHYTRGVGCPVPRDTNAVISIVIRGVVGVMDLVRSPEKLLIVTRSSMLVYCQVRRQV